MKHIYISPKQPKSSLHLKTVKSLSKNQKHLKKIAKYYAILSKAEKWDLHFTKTEGAKAFYPK